MSSLNLDALGRILERRERGDILFGEPTVNELGLADMPVEARLARRVRCALKARAIEPLALDGLERISSKLRKAFLAQCLASGRQVFCTLNRDGDEQNPVWGVYALEMDGTATKQLRFEKVDHETALGAAKGTV